MAIFVVMAAVSTVGAAAAAPTAAPTATGPAPVKLFVSPAGRAEWSGTLPEPNADRSDGPLPSIVAARDRIRSVRGQGRWAYQPITVLVAAGTYYLAEPIVLSPEDSGTHEAPVLYTAAGADRPVISGGREIGGWRPVDRNGRTLWAAEVPEVRQGKWYFRQLFVNGERRLRIRRPREGFYQFTGLPQAKPDTPWNQGQTQATFRPGDIRRWTNLGDAEIVALHFWVDSHLTIEAVDESAQLVKFARSSTFRLTDDHSTQTFARYYVENVFEALESPGEWYLDRPTGTLYYLPKPGETPENVRAVAPRLDRLVRVLGDASREQAVRFLELSRLAFQHADWSLPKDDAGSVQAAVEVPGAIFFQDAEHCSITDCTVSAVSTYAIEVGARCNRIVIAGNELTDLGAGGVKVGHDSTRTTVMDNEIGPGGLIFHSAVGVWIGSSGHNTVTHNHIHHLYYTGISVGWSWGYAESKAVHNNVSYNHIHDIGQGWLSDMGGIYTLGVSPGTKLRYNLIHDVDAHSYGGWGLYNDEGSTGIVLENNIVYRTKHAGYHQHYGRENVVRNNVFAFGRLAQVQRSREEEHISFIFERNIVTFDAPALLDGTWKNDKFTMDRNVYYRAGGQPFDFAGTSFDDWKKRGHDEHSIIADPMFVDPTNGDFALRSGSPAEKIGFEPIDASTIGHLKAQP